MKRIVLIAISVVTVLVLAAVAVPFLVPSSVYKAQIEKAAATALQRDVALTGDVNISVFPRISASVEGVTVSNPEGFSDPHMITADALRGSVKWGPLLSRRVEVQEIAFENANVTLERLADGRVNWDFERGETDSEAPTGEVTSVDAGIEKARLINANVSYRDAVSGAAYDLENFTVEASARSLDEALKAKGEGLFQSQKFRINLTLDTPQAIMDGTAAQADLSVESDLGSAAYKGMLTLGEAPSLAGDFEMTSEALAEIARFAEVEVPVDLSRLGRVSCKGNVSGPLAALAVRMDSLTQTSDLMTTGFTGEVRLGDVPTVAGALELSTADIAAVAAFADIEMPYNLAPLGAATVKAKVSGDLTQPKLDFEGVNVKGALIDAIYKGAVTLGDVPQLDGSLKAVLPDVGELTRQMNIDVPAQEALESIDVETNLSGPVDAVRLSGVSLKHKGALLDAEYSGDVSMAGDGALKGELKASSNDMRALLAAADVELSPGETLKSFALDGAVDGTLKTIAMPRVSLSLDDLQATGSANADMSGDVPVIGADLTLPRLDLTPFMGESSGADAPAQKATAWSKDPLDLAGLKAVNADIALNAGEIIIGKTQLKDATLSADLKGGRLTADMSKFSAFGGDWNGKVIINAQNSDAPIVSFNMKGDGILASDMLNTFAGIDRLTGQGAFELKGAATGNSIREIMNGLDGTLSADLSDGALKGINVGQLVRSAGSLREALQSGSLGSLDFSNVLSPAAETDFTEFDAVLKIEDGVAQVDILKLLNPVLGLDGTGQINLGGQSLDIRLATSIDQSGAGSGSVVQLNGIPVPVRISGSWDNLKLTPDLSGVRQALVAEASGRVRDELGSVVRDQLGGDDAGDLGNVLGDVLGLPRGEGQQPEPSEPPAGDPAPEDEAEPAEEEEQPETVEDAVEDLARDALKDLFGRPKKE